MKSYYSISQVNCFRGCKQEWEYSYSQRLKPRAPQRPLYIGSTLHKLLEIRAKGESWQEYLHTKVAEEFNRLSQTYQVILGDDFIDCCDKIMRQYDWAWGEQDKKINYLATEVKIESKIKGSKYFVGVVDAIIEIDGEQYIVEHKTFKNTKMSQDQTWLNQQTCLYIKILNQNGYNIKGVLWDMLKTQAYKPPKVLKDGSFGKQYSDQTVMSFLDEGIVDIPEHIYNDIKDNHLNFLDRYFTPVLPEVVESVWKDFCDTVDEIAKNKSATKNLGKDCDWCSYKDLCHTELTGGDVNYIKQLFFTTPYEREKEIIQAFYQTEKCKACQEECKRCELTPDPKICVMKCEKYKKYKEDYENNE